MKKMNIPRVWIPPMSTTSVRNLDSLSGESWEAFERQKIAMNMKRNIPAYERNGRVNVWSQRR